MIWRRRNVLTAAAALLAGGAQVAPKGAAGGMAGGGMAGGMAGMGMAGGMAGMGMAGGSMAGGDPAAAHASGGADGGGRGVMTPHVGRLGFVMKDGVKEFHLIAGEYRQEFAPGFHVRVWGYNGSSPGPTIEAVEGDRVRILVTNRLPEPTTVHWHGVLVPAGMDGVAGISAPSIPPGQTFAYEFTLRQHGTQMYHPHCDETKQIALGMMGMFVIHPRGGDTEAAARDYAWMTHAWRIDPGTDVPNPATMTDFNIWTLNGRVFPAIAPMLAATGETVRIRVGNLSMMTHPMHLHGHHFFVCGTDGGPIPHAARWREATVAVPVGTTRDVVFVADNPGDWAYHCHRSHHTMNAMSHSLPNLVGVDRRGLPDIGTLVPGAMAMDGMAMDGMGGTGAGATGAGGGMKMAGMDMPGMDMAGMGMGGMKMDGGGRAMPAGEPGRAPGAMPMRGPANTLPMMLGKGPYGPIGMGGMFTLLKVRDGLTGEADPGWYVAPPGTVAHRVG